MLFLPAVGIAQTPGPLPEDRLVAVMPFTGETEAANIHFRDTVNAEIWNIPGNFQSAPQPLPPGVSPGDFPPDEPPPPYITGDKHYGVTGASFFDDGEHHLQVWLWDLSEPTLIYTDELVCEELDQADEYITLLVDWIFSHISWPQEEEEEEGEDFPLPLAVIPPEREAEAPAAPAPPAVEEDKRFQVGGRIGGSVRLYSIPTGAASQVPFTDKQALVSPSFEAALQGTIQILPFLALQGEILFTMDFVSLPAFNYKGTGNTTMVESTVNMRYSSLMFPLLVKLTFRPAPFVIAPYGGASFILPLGNIELTSPWEADYKSETLSYHRDLPFAWIAGVSLALPLDRIKKGLPGRVFADVRFTSDMGLLSFDQTPHQVSEFIDPFKRNMLSVSAGYELGLPNRNTKGARR